MNRIDTLIAQLKEETKLTLEAVEVITTDYEQGKVIKDAEEIINKKQADVQP